MIKLNKKTVVYSVFIFLVLSLYFNLRPTVIIHTYQKSGYLGKVSRINGVIDKLYIRNHKVKYRLPHWWKWKEGDELAFFTKNYGELFTKENINFFRLNIFLDEDGYYINSFERNIFGIKKD